METNNFNTSDELENNTNTNVTNQEDFSENDDESQDDGKGEDEQAGDVNNSDIKDDDQTGDTIGTNGGNDEKKDNTAENAREVRENDQSEGEE